MRIARAFKQPAKLLTGKIAIWFMGIGFLLLVTGCADPVVIESIDLEYDALEFDLKEPNAILQGYQQVLDDYIAVSKDNRIDYQRLRGDQAARGKLDRFLAWAGQVEGQKPDYIVGSQKRLAYLINVHNALALSGVFQFEPFDKLSELPGDFFEIVRLKMADEYLSLHQIAQQCGVESGWQVAFALGGPNRSDPFIAETIYTPENLSQQLNEAVKNYIGSCAGLRVDHARYRILLGKLLYDRIGFFTGSYFDRYNIENVSVVSALVPWSAPRTQEQLVELVGYEADEQIWDDRLNQVVEDEEAVEGIDDFICGIK
ncbi:MAG: DUF547 domain-containing protein [Planctomycetes bacterium]|nr:DUF547 domain-containing protein [Planctomycetota bacterium]